MTIICPFVRAAEDSPGNKNEAIKSMRIEAWHIEVVIMLNQEEEEHNHITP